MTAQAGETLVYEGHRQLMHTEPLRQYFELGGRAVEFSSESTALWRGYIGCWEIIDGRLYMIGISGTLLNGAPARLESIFPGYPERVFAHWYTGRLRVPEGEMIRYVHMGYESVFERDLLIDVDRGVVVAKGIRHNSLGEAAPDLPDTRGGEIAKGGKEAS
jgi:hypothetical protein